MQLENLVQQVLPPNAYQFQASLSKWLKTRLFIELPNLPGPIVIDAKFPLEAWYELGEARDESEKLAACKKMVAVLANMFLTLQVNISLR